MNKLECRCINCLLMHMNFAIDTTHTAYIHICLHVKHYHDGSSTFEIGAPTHFNGHTKVSG
jgi:hypothetical protein